MKVLICEDDPKIRAALKEILTEEGYQIIEAGSGAEAIKLIARESPQFVCLDIMLPDMSGYDVCRLIRQEHPRLAIMFISAKGDEIDRVLGLELGADDYLVKPFGLKEVISRIRAISRRCLLTTEKTAEFRFGCFTVKAEELRAFYRDRVIELSLRDTKILKLLYRKANTVVTRETLFDECWGMNYLPNSRTLDQHISKLRKKLGEDSPENSSIETVHGVGYRYRP